MKSLFAFGLRLASFSFLFNFFFETSLVCNDEIKPHEEKMLRMCLVPGSSDLPSPQRDKNGLILSHAHGMTPEERAAFNFEVHQRSSGTGQHAPKEGGGWIQTEDGKWTMGEKVLEDRALQVPSTNSSSGLSLSGHALTQDSKPLGGISPQTSVVCADSALQVPSKNSSAGLSLSGHGSGGFEASSDQTHNPPIVQAAKSSGCVQGKSSSKTHGLWCRFKKRTWVDFGHTKSSFSHAFRRSFRSRKTYKD